MLNWVINFTDLLRKQWDDLKKELENFVINVRNKVMHHRPIRFYEIKTLEKVQQKFIIVFDSAKNELSEQQRSEAQQEIQEIEVTKERNPIDLSVFGEYMQKSYSSDLHAIDVGIAKRLKHQQDILNKSIENEKKRIDLLFNSRSCNPIISELPKPMAFPNITENIKTVHLHTINIGIAKSLKQQLVIPHKSIVPLNKPEPISPQLFSKFPQISTYSTNTKSTIKTEKSVDNETDSGLVDELIEQENKFHDANSNEDNIIADENELDQNS